MTNVIDFPKPLSDGWKRVAAEVRAEVARANLKQSQLSELTGISTSTLNRRLSPKVERDSFQVFELERIASVLGVDMKKFFASVDDGRGPDDGGTHAPVNKPVG
ncbi:helix-turn-helix transcriptional regulator [Mycolicibacterium peregrinum]|uniref:helix-turn-helix domain-containing protein n=1 Tax=Mycolicibacterium peregrinum TaxID=43304 RepID=UPI0006D85F97|nr:helix-turn-helix transcriptional regulator [Mycolicibacterium peregrinum]MCV7205270.1 helix-turn-helix transcriptional regulator [Mycolicibacterium peregrinum]ORW54829.1 hypothetical protein AWC21_24125 [Mycolicibacterium peregrinum]